MRTIFALILLIAFGLGPLAGPHACGIGEGAKEEPRTSSCHEMAETVHHPAKGGADAPSPEKSNCCDTFCRHACHTTAVAGASPVAFAITPVAQAVIETSDPGLPLFAQAIDHIPLA
jgi:hypothetical protein